MSKEGMRVAPTTPPKRYDLHIETAPNTMTSCQLYYTPQNGSQTLEPLSEAPVAPQTLSPRRRLVGRHVQGRIDRENKYDAELRKFEVDMAAYLEAVEQRKSQLPTPELIFTHGRGSGFSDATVAAFAEGFARISPVLCFDGNDNMLHRSLTFRSLVRLIPDATAVGGRSMGACVSARMPLFSAVRKLILFGYPLIRHLGDRDEGLLALDETTDVLFIVGEADPFCPGDILKATRAKIRARSWCITIRHDNHAFQFDDAIARKNLCDVLGQLAAQWNINRRPDLTEMSVGLVGQQADWDDWRLAAEAI